MEVLLLAERMVVRYKSINKVCESIVEFMRCYILYVEQKRGKKSLLLRIVPLTLFPKPKKSPFLYALLIYLQKSLHKSEEG